LTRFQSLYHDLRIQTKYYLFRLGLKIGVDDFAHASHYRWNGKIEDQPKNDITLADIQLTAQKKVVVIPTERIVKNAATDLLHNRHSETCQVNQNATQSLTRQRQRDIPADNYSSQTRQHRLGQQNNCLCSRKFRLKMLDTSGF